MPIVHTSQNLARVTFLQITQETRLEKVSTQWVRKTALLQQKKKIKLTPFFLVWPTFYSPFCQELLLSSMSQKPARKPFHSQPCSTTPKITTEYWPNLPPFQQQKAPKSPHFFASSLTHLQEGWPQGPSTTSSWFLSLPLPLLSSLRLWNLPKLLSTIAGCFTKSVALE